MLPFRGGVPFLSGATGGILGLRAYQAFPAVRTALRHPIIAGLVGSAAGGAFLPTLFRKGLSAVGVDESFSGTAPTKSVDKLVALGADEENMEAVNEGPADESLEDK